MREQHTKISEGGRLIIPAAYRKALNIHTGDELIIRLQDGEIRLFRQAQAIERIRTATRKLAKQGKRISQTDAFLVFRKQDSE